MFSILVHILSLLNQLPAQDGLLVAQAKGALMQLSTLNVSHQSSLHVSHLTSFVLKKGEHLSYIASSKTGFAVSIVSDIDHENRILLYSRSNLKRSIKQFTSFQPFEMVWLSDSLLLVLNEDHNFAQTVMKLGNIQVVCHIGGDQEQTYKSIPGFSDDILLLGKVLRTHRFSGHISRSMIPQGGSWLWPPGHGTLAQVSPNRRFLAVNRSSGYINITSVIYGAKFTMVWDLPIEYGNGFTFFDDHYLATLKWNPITKREVGCVFDLELKKLVGCFDCLAIG